MYNYNSQTNAADFVCDAASELSDLPTLSSFGQENLEWMKPVSQGSTAFVIATSTAYMLGSDGWQEI